MLVCPIEKCNKMIGYIEGQEAWCHHGGVGYKMVVKEVEC